jgi:hypothetical protein
MRKASIQNGLKLKEECIVESVATMQMTRELAEVQEGLPPPRAWTKHWPELPARFSKPTPVDVHT